MSSARRDPASRAIATRTFITVVLAATSITVGPVAIPQSPQEFGVHRLRASGRRIGRDTVPRPDVLQVWILIQQIMRYVAFLQSFERGRAGVGRHERVDVQLILRAANQRFRQITRVVRNIDRSEEHTSELQSLAYLVCRLLLEKKKKKKL